MSKKANNPADAVAVVESADSESDSVLEPDVRSVHHRDCGFVILYVRAYHQRLMYTYVRTSAYH